jgi:formylmethanofuran dehydrogenase subunit E
MSVAERSRLELQAVRAWRKWGDGYAMFTRCDECGELTQCRGKTRRRMLCLACFDLGPEGER